VRQVRLEGGAKVIPEKPGKELYTDKESMPAGLWDTPGKKTLYLMRLGLKRGDRRRAGKLCRLKNTRGRRGKEA